jgi:hypothetical protein
VSCMREDGLMLCDRTEHSATHAHLEFLGGPKQRNDSSFRDGLFEIVFLLIQLKSLAETRKIGTVTTDCLERSIQACTGWTGHQI